MPNYHDRFLRNVFSIPAKALGIVLISRFSELTVEQNRKIDDANLNQLADYLERVCVAKTVAEVLRSCHRRSEKAIIPLA